MGSKVSTLTVSLKDDVSGKAGQIGRALKGASDQARAMARAMEGSGASKGFVNNLARLGLSAKDIGRVSDSLKDYAKSAGIAGKASDWTKAQTAQVRAWETATVASLRHVQAEQKTLAKGAHDLVSGMGAAGRTAAQQIAASRRLAEGMGAPARAAQIAHAQAVAEAAAVERRRRASASGDLIAGMGGAGRVTAEHIAQGRRVAEGMGASGRVSREAQERAAAEAADRVAASRDARRALAGGAGLYLGHKVAEGTHATLHTYREFDKERRFGKVVMGLTDEEQKPLVDQAVHMGATTKFNDVQVLESQRELAARGLKKDQVMGLMGSASDLGGALDLTLPEAVKQMEGAIFGFKKPMATLEEAMASAKQTADVQVKAAKISGMTPDDIRQVYTYGAQPARMGGLSEQTLLAFGAMSKKANISGDTAGTAFRALVANALSPTRGAKEAMLANGMDYKNYQKAPERIDTAAFTKTVAAQYGVKLDKATQVSIEKIFTDKAMIADPSKFTPAVMKLLGDNLGGDDAKSKKSIAGLANRFRDKSMQGVDTDRLVQDLMKAIPQNPSLANALFGSKQGGRIANALGNPEEFKHMLEELIHHAEGFAGDVNKERMAGYDGAMSRLEGSVKNLESAVGRSWDNDGKGGFLTGLVDSAAKATQALADLPKPVLAIGAAAGWATGKVASAAGTLALVGAAFSLKGSAAALTSAAARLGLAGGAGPAAAAAVTAGLATGLALIGTTVATAIAAGFALKATADMLPKVANTVGPGGVDPATGGLLDANPMEGLAPDKPYVQEWLKKQLPSVFGQREGSLPPGTAGMPQPVPARLPGLDGRVTPRVVPETMGPNQSGPVPAPPRRPHEFGSSSVGSESSSPTVAPKVETGALDRLHDRADAARTELEKISGVSVSPQVSTGNLDALIAKANEALSVLQKIPGAAAAAGNSAVNGIRARAGAGSSFQTPDYQGP